VVVVDDIGVDDVEEDVNVVGFDAALVDVDEGGEVVVSGVVVVDDVAVDDVEEDVNVVVPDAAAVDNVTVVDIGEDVEV
ncbi:unnamed protein product, partial [Rotaria sp. Silwood2]